MDITQLFMITGAGGGGGGGGAPVLESQATTIYAAAGTSHTSTAPSGISDGDLLVLLISNGQGSTPTVTLPAGWTQRYISNSTWSHLLIATKVASGESGDYTWTSAISTRSASAVLRISGTDAIHKGVISKSSTVSSYTAASVTTTEDDCLILRIGTTEYDTNYYSTITSPATLVFEINTNIGSSYAAGAEIRLSQEEKATAGATGTATFSHTGGANTVYITSTLAFAPSA